MITADLVVSGQTTPRPLSDSLPIVGGIVLNSGIDKTATILSRQDFEQAISPITVTSSSPVALRVAAYLAGRVPMKLIFTSGSSIPTDTSYIEDTDYIVCLGVGTAYLDQLASIATGHQGKKQQIPILTPSPMHMPSISISITNPHSIVIAGWIMDESLGWQQFIPMSAVLVERFILDYPNIAPMISYKLPVVPVDRLYTSAESAQLAANRINHLHKTGLGEGSIYYRIIPSVSMVSPSDSLSRDHILHIAVISRNILHAFARSYLGLSMNPSLRNKIREEVVEALKTRFMYSSFKPVGYDVEVEGRLFGTDAVIRLTLSVPAAVKIINITLEAR